jgi:CcmD family protein
MQNFTYLLAANVVVWLGIGAYVAFLAGRSRRLARRIEQLELFDER